MSWDYAIIGLAILAAGGWLGWRSWRTLRGKGACHQCGESTTCPFATDDSKRSG